MDIQAKTNEELRTKLSNLLQEKKSLWVQIEKLAAGLVTNEKLSLLSIKRKCSRINHRQQRTYFQNKEKEKRQQRVSYC
jgi:hypothetical protein